MQTIDPNHNVSKKRSRARLLALAVTLGCAGGGFAHVAAKTSKAGQDASAKVAEARASARVRVGAEVQTSLASKKPYAPGPRGDQLKLVQREVLRAGEASYIAPHFAEFDLDPGDVLVVRSPDGKRSWRYQGYGKGREPRSKGFWAIHIPGDTAIIELHSFGGSKHAGFRIDRYVRGFKRSGEAICAGDDSLEAVCYQGSASIAYKHARPVARLLIDGAWLCTGWLVGNQGHLMTNNHCIATADEALNTDYEFMAEGATCATACNSQLGCPGVVEANSATLLATDGPLDYALVQLPTNPTSTYGFLQLRSTGAVLDERIYIPQHPAGWGKRIALHSTHASDASGFVEVESLNEVACSGAASPDVGYFGDTQTGSSGSPVLGSSDHRVVALHHCAGETANCGEANRGVPIQAIITDLGTSLPDCALPGAGCPDPNDTWMRDTWADTGLEPDPATAAQAMYQSPYIWVRNNNDGVANSHIHQNPIAGATNYVYAKLHGGTGPSSTGHLEIYYANASTGLGWPADWTLIGSAPVSGISTGEAIVELSWTPPGAGHYCLVARWVSSGNPMTSAEGGNINVNVRQNNNIVWRNVNVVALGETGNALVDFIVRNLDRRTTLTRLDIRVPARDQLAFPVQHGRLVLRLPPDIHARWKEAGGRLLGLKPLGDGAFEVIAPRGGRLYGIPLGPRESFKAELYFERNEKTGQQTYHIEAVQFGADQEEVGGVAYVITNK